MHMLTDNIIDMYQLRLTDIEIAGERVVYKFPTDFNCEVFLCLRHIDGRELPEHKYVILLVWPDNSGYFIIDELIVDNDRWKTYEIIRREIRKFEIPFSLN